MASVSDIIKSIGEEKFAPVYLLSGKEKFFHDQIINALTSKLFADSSSRSLNRIMLHGSENSLSDVVNASLSYPMLSNNKLVVVKELSRIKVSDTSTFLNYLENPTVTTVLLLSTEEMGKTKLFIELKKKAVFVDCKPVPDYKIPAIIKERLGLKKKQMSSRAVTMLAEYTGNSLLNIEHELEKVKEYKSDGSEIGEDDIIAVTGMSKDYNVFTLQKMLSEKNLERSFVIGKKLIEKGENINLLISVLFNYFRKALLVAKGKSSGQDFGAISRELKINEYQQRDISATLKYFSPIALENVVSELHVIDKKAKSTASTDWALVQSLCFTICRL
ncbi:MAG: DNA polymerase III subunit delta [Calditrichaeota bacterium]|nr:MAG: DNA polymerase III subunit delta [Calditrichota bacterium]MBL1205495.1 DNA polymerase III subunit delta [Calditrichota bacterium]NOG45323.1 DNA polymerase III subunit delta [Calditrichota bacterium]